MPGDTPSRDVAGAPVVVDKQGKLAQLIRTRSGTMELGCGPARRHADAVTVDALDFPDVDVVGDVFQILASIPDGSVDAVHSYHFLEHVAPLAGIVRECSRVLKPHGLLHAVVPHFSNPYFHSDYTHRQTFGLYSFSYLAEDTLFRRRVPRYQLETGLVLEDVHLTFKAPPPFYLRYAFRRTLGAVVNSSRLTQEWYEAGWSGIFPCYELDFRLRRG
jgi:SAM-dependent methyltransferase